MITYFDWVNNELFIVNPKGIFYSYLSWTLYSVCFCSLFSAVIPSLPLASWYLSLTDSSVPVLGSLLFFLNTFSFYRSIKPQGSKFHLHTYASHSISPELLKSSIWRTRKDFKFLARVDSILFTKVYSFSVTNFIEHSWPRCSWKNKKQSLSIPPCRCP